jgi:hypothetical protein
VLAQLVEPRSTRRVRQEIQLRVLIDAVIQRPVISEKHDGEIVLVDQNFRVVLALELFGGDPLARAGLWR